MSMIRAVLALLVVLLSDPTHAHAERVPPWRAAYERAKQAEAVGQWSEALSGYEEAYLLGRNPRLLFFIGRACAEGGVQQARGIEALDEYVRQVPDDVARAGEKHADVKALKGRLAAMRQQAQTQTQTQTQPEAKPEAKVILTGGGGAVTRQQTAPTPPLRREGLAKKWWLWTLVGGVVAAGVVTTSVLLTRPQEMMGIENSYPNPRDIEF